MLAQAVEALFRAARPEGDALAGRHVGVQRSTEIQQRFERLPRGKVVRDRLAIGASEGSLIVDHAKRQGGRDEKTDYQQSESHRLA